MWIRSQNQRAVINANRIVVIGTRESHEIHNIVSSYRGETDYDFLGEYSTEERAVEVLNDVQIFFNNDGRIFNAYNVIVGQHKVFNMPKD